MIRISHNQYLQLTDKKKKSNETQYINYMYKLNEKKK